MGSFFYYGISDEISASDLIWAPRIVDDPMVYGAMLEFEIPRKEGSESENACSRKRKIAKPSSTIGTKDCREKLRRDKLNDRFKELCFILDPGEHIKADKVAILSDATRRLSQLRLEALKHKESNEALHSTMKALKQEKSELRQEKVRLKAEKDRMEQMLRARSDARAFIQHPSACKIVSYANHILVGMWQWLPPAVLDTSQDHVLRPPVA